MRRIWWLFLLAVLFSLIPPEAAERGAVCERGAFAQMLLDAWTAGETQIVLPSALSLAQAGEIYFSLLDAEPAFFWVAHRFGYIADAGQVRIISPVYLCPPEEIAFLRERLTLALARLSAALPHGASDYASAYALHGALAAVTAYGRAETSPLGEEGAYTAYGALSDGYAVCRGYAMAYLLLLAEAGIDAEYIHSESMAHGWVLAELDGRRLHIDVTWDDAEPLTHRYFARTDAAMEAMGYVGWE